MIAAILRIFFTAWKSRFLSKRGKSDEEVSIYAYVGNVGKCDGPESDDCGRLGRRKNMLVNARDLEVCELVVLKALSPARQSWREVKEGITDL